MVRILKDIFQVSLRFIISLQLVLIPICAYPATKDDAPKTPKETVKKSKNKTVRKSKKSTSKEINSNISKVQALLNKLKENDTLTDPKALKTRKAMFDLAEAIEQNNTKKYLERNFDVIKERDYFFLTDQKAEIIEYHLNENENKVVPKIVNTIYLNSYITRPIHTVFKEVHVKYDKEFNALFLEGVTEGEVRLRQHIPDLDIIDYRHDKEFLVIIDRNKGLLLIDMFFARAYLGLAPIPVTRVSSKILETLSAATLKVNKENITMEFINRSTRPVDILPEGLDTVDRNFKDNRLFQAGDFLISYIDKNNQKHLVQFIKRSELTGWVNHSYDILDIMMKVVAPQLLEKESLGVFNKEVDRLVKEGPESVLNISSALFTKNALYKLMQASEGVQQRKAQLQISSKRDKFLYEEWKESFNKITPQLKALSKEEGEILSSSQISTLLKARQEKIEKETKPIKARALRIMANIVQNFKNTGTFVDKHRFTVGALGGGALAGYVFPEQFIVLVNEFLPIFQNMSFGEQFANYQLTTFPHLFTMIVFLPGLIILMSKISVPFIKYLARAMPIDLSFGGRVYHPQGKMKDILSKWKESTIFQRIIGVGMKIVAYSIYPFWNYAASIVGQPHFFVAIQKGLNPFKKIRVESDIGRKVGLENPTRLGISSPQWNKNKKESKLARVLQNTAQAKEQRVQSVAWLLASLAVAEKTNVNPAELLTYGATVYLTDLKRVHEDIESRTDMLWVMENLLKEIRALDELDIRKELIELSPEMVTRYYKKAKDMAQEVKQQPEFRKKFRRIMGSDRIQALKQNINLKTITSLNKDQHETLKNVPTKFVSDRVFSEFSTDHLMVALIPYLTTNRAEFGLENIFQLAANEANFSWAGKPHMQEVWLNVIAHFFIAGGQRTMVFTKKQHILDTAQTEQSNLYEPTERTRLLITETPQGEITYFGKQFAYLGSGGKADNLGGVMARGYIARLRSMQMTITLVVGMRLALTDQSLSEAAMAFLLYHMAGQWMFGWPWDLISGGDRLNRNYLETNSEKMETLKRKLSEIAREVYTVESQYRKDFEKSVKEITELYFNNRHLKFKFLKKIKEINPELYAEIKDLTASGLKEVSLSFPKSQAEVKKLSENLVTMLREHPPLPSQVNKWANGMYTFTFGAFLTTVLFVELAIWTFSAEYLNWRTIGGWAAFNYLAYITFYFAYKKGLKDHWTDARQMRRSWQDYFHGKILNSGRAASNKCKAIFRLNTKRQ